MVHLRAGPLRQCRPYPATRSGPIAPCARLRCFWVCRERRQRRHGRSSGGCVHVGRDHALGGQADSANMAAHPGCSARARPHLDCGHAASHPPSEPRRSSPGGIAPSALHITGSTAGGHLDVNAPPRVARCLPQHPTRHPAHATMTRAATGRLGGWCQRLVAENSSAQATETADEFSWSGTCRVD